MVPNACLRGVSVFDRNGVKVWMIVNDLFPSKEMSNHRLFQRMEYQANVLTMKAVEHYFHGKQLSF